MAARIDMGVGVGQEHLIGGGVLLLGFAGSVFLTLALGKRYAELLRRTTCHMISYNIM